MPSTNEPIDHSRNIGQFFEPYLKAEGLSCAKYPVLYFSRYSIDDPREFVWNMRQLSDCYSIAAALQIDFFDITDRQGSQEFSIHYASVVVTKSEEKWSEPSVVSDTEDVYPGYNTQELLERFECFAGKATKAIIGFLESP